MKPSKASLLAILSALGFALGCFSFPDGAADRVLDYRIDRPRVVGIRIDPPKIGHGLPVTVDALVLAPGEAEISGAEICGLRGELPVTVFGLECFRQPALVDRLSDTAPFTWDPPDLSAIPCPEWAGPDTASPDTGTEDRWCSSTIPLLVSATSGGEPAYGTLDVTIPVLPFQPGDEVPASYASLPRELAALGDARAGEELAIEFRIQGAPYDGFRWYVDDGELLGTGRTAVQTRDGDWYVTRNTLRIPASYTGDLRVAVVAVSTLPAPGDTAWSILTLEVR